MPMDTSGYAPPSLPQTTPRGGDPSYYLPSDQYNPLPVRPTTDQKGLGINQKEFYKQLIPTSINIRNRALQDLLQRIKAEPGMASLAASEGGDAIAAGKQNAGAGLMQNLAARGMVGSGAEDIGMEAQGIDYLSILAANENQARQMGDERTGANLAQLLGLTESDLGFYSAIRSGTVPAGNLFQTNTAWQGQLGNGIQELTKTLVGAGMGGAGGGGGMGMGGGGGGGMNMFGSGGAMGGGGGMSAYGNSGAALFQSGMSGGGGNNGQSQYYPGYQYSGGGMY